MATASSLSLLSSQTAGWAQPCPKDASSSWPHHGGDRMWPPAPHTHGVGEQQAARVSRLFLAARGPQARSPCCPLERSDSDSGEGHFWSQEQARASGQVGTRPRGPFVGPVLSRLVGTQFCHWSSLPSRCQGPKAWDARSHQLRWCHLSTQTVPGTWEKLWQYLLNELTSPCTSPSLIFEKYVLSGGGRKILY